MEFSEIEQAQARLAALEFVLCQFMVTLLQAEDVAARQFVIGRLVDEVGATKPPADANPFDRRAKMELLIHNRAEAFVERVRSISLPKSDREIQ